MKYWICIDSDGTQGIGIGDTVQSEEKPDPNWGSFVWQEITEEQYAKILRKEEYRKELVKWFRNKPGFPM